MYVVYAHGLAAPAAPHAACSFNCAADAFLAISPSRRPLLPSVAYLRRKQSCSHSASVQVSGFVFAAGAFRGFEKGCFPAFFPAFLPGGLAAAVLAGFLGILGGMSTVWMGENGWKWGAAVAGVHRNERPARD